MSDIIEQKAGALHERLLDDVEQYQKMLALLGYYEEKNRHYTADVMAALEDGLKSYERYRQLDNALSPRCIKIEKRIIPEGEKLRVNDTEGAYHVVFSFDDGKEAVVHFDRKQDQLLYILMLLFAHKNGFSSELYRREDNDQYQQLKATTMTLLQMLYPVGKKREDILVDLDPDVNFTHVFQRMKKAVNDLLKKHDEKHEHPWLLPSIVKDGRRNFYLMQLAPAHIIYPDEFQAVVDALPLVDSPALGQVNRFNKDFSEWKQKADEGDAEGLYMVGIYFGSGDAVSQDFVQSLHYLQQAASLGYVDAFFQLGVFHVHGFGCSQSWKDALPYFAVAAEEGHDEAISYILDAFFHHHEGVEDLKPLSFWMEKARSLNDPAFYYLLGYYHVSLEQPEEAFHYLSLAREEGQKEAYALLGYMLYEGIGVASDKASAIECLKEGALAGNGKCLEILKKYDHRLWKEIKPQCEMQSAMRLLLIDFVEAMQPESQALHFLDLIDIYREIFFDDYQKEINKQLSIHQPSTAKDKTVKRKMLVRKIVFKKANYEVIIILANGKEKVLKLNPNSLVLLLLTIVCSYKSGYNTVMTLDKQCRAVMAKLVMLVLGLKPQAAVGYIDKFMANSKSGTDSYKTYSNYAKIAVKSAVEYMDDANHFLFDNNKTIGQRSLRTMNIHPSDIELPPELSQLADEMPDAEPILLDMVDYK